VVGFSQRPDAEAHANPTLGIAHLMRQVENISQTQTVFGFISVKINAEKTMHFGSNG
jgi:hypothetical protein